MPRKLPVVITSHLPTWPGAVEPFEKIRDAVGDSMDIMVELHAMWDLPQAKRVAAALEPCNPFWFEDPIRMDSLRSLKDFRDSTRVPTTASETLGSRGQFRELLELGACDYVMYDIGWVGGLSEARKIAAMARGLASPGRAPRLHGAGHFRGLGAPRDERDQCPGAGSGPRLLLRLVPRDRERPAAARERIPAAAGRARSRAASPGPSFSTTRIAAFGERTFAATSG